VHAQNGCHVAGGGEALAGPDIAVCNVPTDLGRDLVMKGHGVASVCLDMTHGDNHSVIMSGSPTALREAPAPEADVQELVIREARRRQHRRWLAVSLVAVACLTTAIVGLAGGWSSTTTRPQGPAETHNVTPVGRQASSAFVRGSLKVCGPGPSPAVTLHDKAGTVVATAVWRPASASSTTGANTRTLYFSFSVPKGDYYLTMNNEYQTPPQARQIDLSASQTFTTHLVGCT
jgi:hypothetical protein